MRILHQSQAAQLSENRIPAYVLKNKKPLIMRTSQYLDTYVNEIALIFTYFVKKIGIKKLTIFAFEEGALLTFRTLVEVQGPMASQLFEMIEKVVLINLYNPEVQVYDNEPSEFLEETKRMLFADSSKVSLFNSLRIVYIKTLEVPYPYSRNLFPEHLTFELTHGLYRFRNTISLSTRSMWNVYAQLNSDEYFKFEPFVWLLSRFLLEFRQYDLSNKDIEYFFLFRETKHPRELSASMRTKYLHGGAHSICKDFLL